jgi:signal transduction histidine kinase
VYGIVKQSGGHVWIDSKVGVGTSVTICFAAEQPKAAV